MLPEKIIHATDILIPNEIELETIIGVKITSESDLVSAANKIHELGVKVLIVTLGSKGAFYSIAEGKSGLVPAFEVPAVDTTAAGGRLSGRRQQSVGRVRLVSDPKTQTLSAPYWHRRDGALCHEHQSSRRRTVARFS